MYSPITVDFSDELWSEKLVNTFKAGKFTRDVLQIYISSPVSFERWEALFNALNSNPLTYSLSVYGTQSKNLNDDFFIALDAMLKTNNTIRHLHIKGHNVTHEQIGLLSSAITASTHLHDFSLCEFGLGDEKLGVFLTGISTNRILQSLVFQENNITDEAVPSCVQFLEAHSNVISFDISNNAIGDDGARLFANFLKVNTSLLDFNIGKNPLTNIGDEYFHLAFQNYKGPIVQFRHHHVAMIPLLDQASSVVANNPSLINCSLLPSYVDDILCARVLFSSQAASQWAKWKQSSQGGYNTFTEKDFNNFFPFANAIKFNLSKGEFSNLVPAFDQDLALAYTKAAHFAPARQEIYCCATEIPMEIVELILMAIARVQLQGPNQPQKQH